MMRQALSFKMAWCGLFALCLLWVMPLWAHLKQQSDLEPPLILCGAQHSVQSETPQAPLPFGHPYHKLDSCSYCQLILKVPFIPTRACWLLKLAFHAPATPDQSESPKRSSDPHPRRARSPPYSA
ncbi:DUF2946 family protein [Azomonas agilis]|uniref:DUF2946 family protein n=1 Tax=Azomonas agilis TaxID=116849 RepID=UPI0011A764F0|nr:DUF2946 family protein [Azomonas agilis]